MLGGNIMFIRKIDSFEERIRQNVTLRCLLHQFPEMRLVLFALAICLSTFASAQVPDEYQGLPVMKVIEQMPVFPGGNAAMLGYLAYVELPKQSIDPKLMSTKLIVSVLIDTSGNVVMPQVVQSSGFLAWDEAYLKYIANMPHWTPGKQRGKPFPVVLRIPVIIDISMHRE